MSLISSQSIPKKKEKKNMRLLRNMKLFQGMRDTLLSIINNLIDRFIEVESQVVLRLLGFDPFFELYINLYLQNFERNQSKTLMQLLWSRWRRFLKSWLAKILDFLKWSYLRDPKLFSRIVFLFVLLLYCLKKLMEE